MLEKKDFDEACSVVDKVRLETKLIYSDFLSQKTGANVYLKPENMQFTGAYKLRGAYYKISTLTDEERERGLITASAGNPWQRGCVLRLCGGCGFQYFCVEFRRIPYLSPQEVCLRLLLQLYLQVLLCLL